MFNYKIRQNKIDFFKIPNPYPALNVVAFKRVHIRYYALVPALLPILETLLKLDLWDSL